MGSRKSPVWARPWAAILTLALLYFLAARLGLLFGMPPIRKASPVWPASGIALAGLLLWGPGAWPGVWLGAFLGNFVDVLAPSNRVALGLHAALSVGIACGSTLQALVGTHLIEHFVGRVNPMDRVRTLVRFLGIGLAMCGIASTLGTTTLWAAGLVDGSEAWLTGWVWWTGDAVGVLFITPLLLTWNEAPRVAATWTRIGEGALLAGSLATVSFLVFRGDRIFGDSGTAFPYLTIPILLWAAIRFGRHGATLAVAALAGIAVAETIRGAGPFARPSITASLLLVQLFLGVSAATTMLVSAVMTERQNAVEGLRAAKAAGDAASRAKTDFLAKVSHEIRTPISGILGMTDLALTTNLDAQQVRFLQMARSSADGLLTLINDLLDFSRLESGKVDFDEVPFNLRAHLEDVLKPASVRAANEGLAFDCKLDPAVPEVVVGDPSRLAQIVTNLVNNAVKFTQRGSIGVRVDVEDAPPGEACIHFAVHDTGVGIAPERQVAIFEPFVQADDASTARKYGGAGLGLSIAAELVERMGGRIWLESEPGRGSTFHFTARFALADPDEADDEAGEDGVIEPRLDGAMPRMTRRLRVLVAEDNEINRTMIEHILARQGHDVVAVASGQLALDALAREPFDVVLMDVQMPGLDGIETTAAIRAREKETGGRIPILAMTAFAMRGDRERCLQAGMNGYISKPFQIADLAKAIHDAVSRPGRRALRPVPRKLPSRGDVLRRKELWDRVGGDRKTLERILSGFRAEWRSMLGSIGAAIAAGDLTGAARAAHTVKGALGNLGAARAAEAAREVERAANANEPVVASEGIKVLQGEIERLLPELASMTSEGSRAEGVAE